MSKEKSKRGCPTKYSEELARTICMHLADGLHFKYACNLAGIDESTGHRWKERHPIFASQVRAAISEDVRILVEKVRSKSPEKLLSLHKHYNEKSQIDVINSDGSLKPDFTDEQLKKAALAYLKSKDDSKTETEE